MLQTMRDNAQGLIARIIVGFIIIVFALWGVESIVNLGGGEKPVATVGDYEISRVMVQQKVAEQKSQLRRQFGDQYDEGLFNDKFLEQSALEQLINEKVAQTQADELGLYASTSEIDQAILNTPSFQSAGQFDEEQFKLVLRMNGLGVMQYRAMLADNIKQNQVRSAMMLSTIETPFAMQMRQALDNEQRTFRFTTVKASDFEASVEVSDEEVETFYNDNLERYMTPEKAKASYVLLSNAGLEAEQDVTDEDLEIAYADYQAAQADKEQRQAAHILFEVNDERSEADAVAAAEAAKARLDAGESFASLAQELSDDTGSAVDGGDLGVNPRGAFDPAFDDALFALEKGAVSAPVVTEFGVHLIQAVDVVASDVLPLAEVRAELEASIRSEKAGFLFAERSQELANLAFSAESIQELATNAGLEVQESDFFTAMAGEGIAENDKVRRIAFEDNMKLDRELSELIELGSGSLIFMVSEYQDSAAKPLADVRDSIVAAISAEKALEAAKAKAEEIVAGDDAAATWSRVVATVRQASDAPRAAHQKAFALAQDASAVVSSPEGYTVVKVDNIDRKSWKDMAATDELASLLRNQTARNDMVSYQAWSKANTTIE